MVKKEFYSTRKDGVNLFRTYSDRKNKIKQIETGIVYDEAIDAEHIPYNYVEIEDVLEDIYITHLEDDL